jgi:hypothetical protein
MPRDYLQVKGIEFRDGGIIDGPLFTQLLARLRNVESKESSSSPSTLQFVDYAAGLNLEEARTSVVVFGAAISVASAGFASAQTGSVYRFGNTSSGEIILSDGNATIMKLVPGEFIKLIRLESGWFGTFGP